MRNALLMVAAVATLMFLAAPATADWDPGNRHKMHFPQLPDLGPGGMDVLDGPMIPEPGTSEYYEKFLADDWVCSQSGYVTDIHIWGSHNEDLHLTATPRFSLVIYENISEDDNPAAGYSMPGAAVWDAYVTPTSEKLYAIALEQFYDPNVGDVIGLDWQVWQYNFLFEETEAFYQEEGKTYWLGAKLSFDLDGDGWVDASDMMTLAIEWPAAYGWKTADLNEYPAPYTGEHFMDDAVWIDVDTFGTGGHVVPEPPLWNELIIFGQSKDLAFVITPEPSSVMMLAFGGLALAVCAALRRRRRKA